MSALAAAESKAVAARQALWRLEVAAASVREMGGAMSAAWWAAFGDAKAAVLVAERDLCKARETP